MKAANTEASNEEYWRAFVRWLPTQDPRDRVALVEMCVQSKGPAPDDLRPAIEALTTSTNEAGPALPSGRFQCLMCQRNALADDNADLGAKLAEAQRERDRFRQHSIWLNSIGFNVAEALSRVPEGADAVRGNPVADVQELIRERDSLAYSLAEAARYRDENVRLNEELHVLRKRPCLDENTNRQECHLQADHWPDQPHQYGPRLRPGQSSGVGSSAPRSNETDRDRLEREFAEMTAYVQTINGRVAKAIDILDDARDPDNPVIRSLYAVLEPDRVNARACWVQCPCSPGDRFRVCATRWVCARCRTEHVTAETEVAVFRAEQTGEEAGRG